MKIKTVEQLLATLLIGVLIIGSLFISCEPDNSYYSWENNNDNSYYPWENTSPIEEPTANEQVVPQQFSTNAKILAVKSNDNGCFYYTVLGMKKLQVIGKQKNILYLLYDTVEIYILTITMAHKFLQIIKKLKTPLIKVV